MNFRSENPDTSARNTLRYQKKIADTMTRAKADADRMLALRELAKGVPASVLPADGIHDRMSPADIQAATDRINQWRATNQQGQPKPAGPAQTSSTGNTIADGLLGRKPYQPDAQGPQTRRAQGGGMEQLVQSQSGPRWVSYVPPANVPTRQGLDQSTGPTMVQRQAQNPKPLTDFTGNRTTDAANLAQNRALYQPGGIPAPAPRAYQGPSVETPSQADAMRIAKQYGPEDVNSIPQRSVAGVSPAGARNDINTGGNLPTVPQTAAIQGPPMPAVPPSSPPPVVSDTAPPGYVAGQAVRNAPNVAAQVGQAATGQAQNIARNVVDSVVKPVQGFVSGLTGAPASPPVSPVAPVASRASQSIDLANRVASSITAPERLGPNPIQGPPVPPINPIPVQEIGGVPQPGFDANGNMIRKPVFGGVDESVFARRAPYEPDSSPASTPTEGKVALAKTQLPFGVGVDSPSGVSVRHPEWTADEAKTVSRLWKTPSIDVGASRFGPASINRIPGVDATRSPMSPVGGVAPTIAQKKRKPFEYQ